MVRDVDEQWFLFLSSVRVSQKLGKVGVKWWIRIMIVDHLRPSVAVHHTISPSAM
ncbi:hypothetical protein BDZ94DRAFT_1253715 [Collybia nuda]|uniref:Uncharacterized protein n=1 Tax=Collybia nuda TaxID=64659 RepID=A0A9P5YB18_9AGAR|nr:hypothetical protein BDZ94DRAFT_1253715 [Collybia nuda]